MSGKALLVFCRGLEARTVYALKMAYQMEYPVVQKKRNS